MTNAGICAIINLVFAGVAHLVERDLAKVEVASSSLVARSKKERHPHGCLSFLEQHFCCAKVVACGRVIEREWGNPSKVPPSHSPFLAVGGSANNKACGQSKKPPRVVFFCVRLGAHRRPLQKEYLIRQDGVFFLEMCRSAGEIAASTCAKRVKSGGETGHRRSLRKRNAAAVNVRC